MAQGQSYCASNIISNSHRFHFKWVDPPIPELQQFHYFTFKIQGQGHGWDQSLKSRCDSIDSHPFRPMSISHPIPEIRLFQNLTLKIQGQDHGWGGHWKSQNGSNILSAHIPLIPCQLAILFLRYAFFKIWPWKSKVKVMVEVKVESLKVGVTSYRLKFLSFHVNRPSHSWDTAFSKFDLENPRSRSWVRWTLKVTKRVQHSIDSHPFNSMSIGHPIPDRYNFFKIWPWKSKGKVMGEGNVESHKVGVTILSIHIPSFHVNRPFHSWDTAFSKFDLENPRSMLNDHDVAQPQV